MSNVTLRPDLRTAGGEVNDIMFEGRYAGTVALVYREGERISGSIQLERESISKKRKSKIIEFTQNYIEALADALDAPECDVSVTYSTFDHFISTDEFVNEDELMTVDDLNGDIALDYEYDYVDADTRFDDVGYQEIDEYKMDEEEAVYYELVIVGESRNTVEYHVYDKNKKWMAEAFMTIYGNDVVGEVNWMQLPDEDQIGHVTDLIVSDFDEQEIDSFLMDVKYKGEVIAIEELAHTDLIDEDDLAFDNDDDDDDDDEEINLLSDHDEYSVILSRDDQDTLTYEIYKQSHSGGVSIGTATVDISQRHLSGFINFSVLEEEHDRDHIASLLMSELDKEKEYDTMNITILHQNEPVDEVLYETEQIH